MPTDNTPATGSPVERHISVSDADAQWLLLALEAARDTSDTAATLAREGDDAGLASTCEEDARTAERVLNAVKRAVYTGPAPRLPDQPAPTQQPDVELRRNLEQLAREWEVRATGHAVGSPYNEAFNRCARYLRAALAAPSPEPQGETAAIMRELAQREVIVRELLTVANAPEYRHIGDPEQAAYIAADRILQRLNATPAQGETEVQDG